jgi:hypothetical protein
MVPQMSSSTANRSRAGWRLRKEIIEWGLLILGGVLVYLLAIYGWWATGRSTGQIFSVSEILNMSLDTLSGKSYLLIDRSPIPPNEALGYAAMGAKLLFGFAVIKGTLLIFGRKIRGWFFRRTRGHNIICGAGERGDAIARKLVEHGERVAVIELDPANEKIGELKELGAHVIQGNAHDALVLRAAGVRNAKRLIAVTSKDETNLAVCREATNMSDCQARAGVESFELRSYFSDRLSQGEGGGAIRLESFQCRAARQLMLEVSTDLLRIPELWHRSVVLVIEAADPFRDELIRAAAVMLQISGEKKPVLEITCAGDDDKKSFESRFPEAHLVVDLRWHSQSADELFPESSPVLPDAALFALATDALTLESAERFRLRHPLPPNRIFALLRSTSELYDLASAAARGTSAGDDASVKVRNLFGLGLGDDDPLDEKIDKEAAALHLEYCRREKKKDASWSKFPENWANLGDNIREANRLQAAHLQVKKEAWKSRRAGEDEKLLLHLARSEHMRWMAVKAMDGWRWTGSNDKNSRNDKRKIHHQLVPFDHLDADEIAKDLEPIKRALGIT